MANLSKVSLAVKYRPKTWNDVCEQGVTKKILDEQLKNGDVKRVLLFTGPPGCGKAQPLTSLILTPNGYIKMGDIKLGDVILDGSGNLTAVTGIYPQGKRRIFKINFSDRSHIKVSDEHLNSIFRYNQDRKCNEYFTLTTLELINLLNTSRFKLRVEVPVINCWEDHDQKIDPYLLGLLIADGSLSEGNFALSNVESDIIEKVRQIVSKDGYIVKSRNNKDWSISRPQLTNSQHNLNLDSSLRQAIKYYKLDVKSIHKHIPHQYLFSSYETRLSLLQGMFDGDGYTACIGKNGSSYNYSTSSAKLSEDFSFLVRSLGIVDTVVAKQGKYKDKNGVKHECNVYYTHYLKVPNNIKIFTSKKHNDRYRKKQLDIPIRKIVSIEEVEPDECQCIMVDSDLHTYITDNVTPTHNTTSARIFANELEKCSSNIIEINAASNTGVDDVRRIIDLSKTKPLQGSRKVFIIDEVHSLSVNAFNALLKILEEPPEYCIYILCTTDPQKIIPTILSRAFRYNFQKISQNGIIQRLDYILNAEINDVNGCGIKTWNMESLQYLAKASGGGMRDAITLLEKCIGYSKDLTTDVVEKVIDITSYDLLFDILDSLIEKNEAVLLTSLNDIYMSGKDMKLFVKNFLAFLLDVSKYIVLGNMEYLTIPSNYEDKLKKYNINVKDYIKFLIVKILQLNTDIKWESNPKTTIESSLLLEVL